MDRVKIGKAFLILLLALLLSACSNKNEDEIIRSSEQTPLKELSLELKEHKTYEREITLSAIGDVLIHSPVFKDALGESGYHFTPMLESVKPFLNRSTITIANQETMIGGVELGLSSYPSFNSPQEVGDALKEVGVDVVTLANNHTLDRGEAAIQSALEHWETIDMMYTGAYKDQVDREHLRIIESEEGISSAFLSYTYGTNGIPVPDGKDYLVNLIDKEKIGKEIQLAKEEADVVVLSLHFGNEYERMPNEEQKDLVQYAADQGVHVVIGHHPHVLQPVDWVTGKEGNKTLVVYSLGNFLSNQQELHQRIGGIFNFSVKKVTKGEEVEVEVHSPSFIPTYVTFTPYFSNYEVVPMCQLTNAELSGAENVYQEVKEHMSRWVPELAFPEE